MFRSKSRPDRSNNGSRPPVSFGHKGRIPGSREDMILEPRCISPSSGQSKGYARLHLPGSRSRRRLISELDYPACAPPVNASPPPIRRAGVRPRGPTFITCRTSSAYTRSAFTAAICGFINFNGRKDHAFRVAAKNNCTIWRRILVRHPGTSAGAYRDMCRRM
jgi:hypothetical protein